jgi:asparagine synthase (glutamine-hydrolysing)
MWLMSYKIDGDKMVLSGEGADELFGGICIFTAPNAQEFHEENVRKLGKLHMYDCLRANKSLQRGNRRSCSVLDKEFMDVATN